MVDTHDDILELMVEVADRVIRPRFRALSGNDIDEKSPRDYVTVADRESEKLLTAALLDDRVDIELIADGVHIHPAVLELALRRCHDQLVDWL